MAKSKETAAERREREREENLAQRGWVEDVELSAGRIRIVRREVSDACLDVIFDAADRMSKRAARLGLEEIQTNVISTEYRKKTVYDADGRMVLGVNGEPLWVAEPSHTIEIIGPSCPLIKPGYTLIGVASNLTETDINDGTPRLVTRVDNGPDDDPRLDAFRDETKNLVCAHCQANRKRKAVLLVETPDQQVIGVGLDCAEEYVEMRRSVVDFIADLQEKLRRAWGGGITGTPFLLPLDGLLETALYAFEHRGGYRSATLAKELGVRSTADWAMWLLQPPPPRAEAEREDWFVERRAFQVGRAKYSAQVESIKQYVAGITPRNDYEHNLVAAFRLTDQAGRSVVARRSWRIAVSALVGWSRDQARREREQRAVDAARLPQSVHFGEVGERKMWGTAMVEGVIPFNSAFSKDGTGYIVRLKFVDGRRAKWFASVFPQLLGVDLTLGTMVTVTGTVKKHDEYKGVKETLINRVVFGPAAVEVK